jgi:hypothetical protein
MRRNRRWQADRFEDWIILGALVFMVLAILAGLAIYFGLTWDRSSFPL